MLDPLQEGGAVTASAVAVLEQLVVKSRHLLKDNMKGLPPLPQGVDRLGTFHLDLASCCCCCSSFYCEPFAPELQFGLST